MSKYDPILGSPMSEAALSAKHMRSVPVEEYVSDAMTRHGKVAVVMAALSDFHNLSGRVTDIQAGHAVDRLEGVKSAGDKVSSDFVIKVGGVYLDDLKEIVTIIRDDPDEAPTSSHHFVGDNGKWYSKTGEALDGNRWRLGPFDPIARIKELEACLRHTRKLVSLAAPSGFTEDGPIDLIFRNNGAISRVVPIRPVDRLSDTLGRSS